MAETRLEREETRVAVRFLEKVTTPPRRRKLVGRGIPSSCKISSVGCTFQFLKG